MSVESTAAVLYHPDGYLTSRDKLMGRHAAGEGFLRGYARYVSGGKLYAFAETRQHFDQFRQQVEPYANGKPTEWLPQADPGRLVEPGALYIPGPGLPPHAWQRRCRDALGYSVTGVTHTICSDRVMDSIGDLLVAPVEEWDALIFTSGEVKTAAQNMLAAYGQYLSERFHAPAPAPRLQMPVIPLGVDCDHFGRGGDPVAIRQDLRRQHGIGEEDVAILFLGRLSYHAKAHPLAMYQSLEAAARETGRKLHLIEAGWFANDPIKNAFIEGARLICPSVHSIHVDGRKLEVRDNIWLAADIFCSFSDNIQETFGLTPVEAMAAGLPVVVSDWDGYRDTVEQGATGFKIPTAIPAPGCGDDLAYGYYTGADTYDQYIGYVSQAIAVDAEAATRALVELIDNAELRRRMGERGRAKARQDYDWKVIIGKYEELWAELHARRQAARAVSNRKSSSPGAPLRADPFTIYPHYATHVIGADTKIAVALENPFKVFDSLKALQMNRFADVKFLGAEEVKALLRQLRKADSVRVADLLAAVSPERRAVLHRTLGRLLKFGIIKRAAG